MKIPSWALVAIIAILTWAALWLKKIFIRKIGNKQLPFALDMIEKIMTGAIFFIAITLILQTLGIDLLPLLTLSGIGAAVLGFASKDFISNFYGGVMIYMNRPFHVNDYIEIPSKGVAGTVEEIGWYSTTIRNMQKKSIYIPNTFFTTEYLVNDSRMTHRRIEEVLRFRIQDADRAQEVIKEARKILASHPEIDHSEQIDLFLLSIGPYGCVIDLKAYTKTTKYLEFMAIKQEILLKIYRLAQ